MKKYSGIRVAVMSVTPSRLQVVHGGQRLPQTTASVTICSNQQKMHERVEYLRFLCLDDTDAIHLRLQRSTKRKRGGAGANRRQVLCCGNSDHTVTL